MILAFTFVAECMGVGLLLMCEVGTGMCRRLVYVDFHSLFFALLFAGILTGQGTDGLMRP